MISGLRASTEEVEEVIATAMTLCAIPAPSFHEEERAGAVAERLEAAGLDVRRDAVGNVLARLGPEAPVTVFAAHLDTVFPASLPLRPRRDGDRLQGPGIGDNCLGLAALLHLARKLAAGGNGEAPVLLAATVCEEGEGGLRGARAIVDGWDCAAFVAIEGHGVDRIRTRATGAVRYHVAFEGPGGHPWRHRGVPSALHALARCAARSLELAREDVVVNIGRMAGGEAVNAIATRAQLDVELRSADPDRLRELAAQVEDCFRAGEGDRISAHVSEADSRPAGRTPWDHPLVEAARASRRSAGLPPARDESSSTDANAAIGRGIAAITVGMSSGGGNHTPGEWIATEWLPRSLTALELLGAAARRGWS